MQINGLQTSASQEQQHRLQTLTATSIPVAVPERLRSLHAVVTRTKELAASSRKDDAGRIKVDLEPDAFNICVSRSLLPRALRILQAICDEVARRGWELNVKGSSDTRTVVSGARLQVGRCAYEVSIEEKVESLPFTDEDIQRWKATRSEWERREEPPNYLRKRRATGALTLRIPSAWDRSRNSWSDDKGRSVETRLHELFATVAVRAEQDEERSQERERQEALRRELERRDLAERLLIRRLDDDLAATQRG